MKNNAISIFIVAFVVMLISSYNAFSVPATPELISITQPDGSTIEVYIKGDERFHWFESQEQFTLLRNNEGYLVYATRNANNDIIPSQYRYWNDEAKANPTKERTDFLKQLDKKLFFSKRQVEQFITNDAPNVSIKNKDAFQQYEVDDIKGVRKYIVILMSYPDLPFKKTKEEFHRLFNEENYQVNGSGSVRDFYIHNSYGKFTPEFVIFGPYQTYYNMDYYKNNSRALVREGIYWMYDEITNLGNYKMSDFDNTGNGYLDAVNIIFAGWGEEAGYSNGIWSHASALPDDNGPYDNKYIWRYCCSPELSGNSGSNISAIGVMCHEFCHTLGSPDYYDTDYQVGGQYQGAGNWCLMSNGSWNAGGNCPANINIFQKWMYSWVNPIELSTQDMVVTNMPNSAYNPVAYRINTDVADEFYIMENRQKVGFDKYVPGTGLLIWRVHQYMPAYLYYGYNGINNTHPQIMYPVCASSIHPQPTQGSSSYGSINSSGTPFPGSSENTAFTDNSIPSAVTWDGKPNFRPITNITEVNSLINFNFKGRPNILFRVPPAYVYDIENAKHFDDYYTTYSVEDVGVRWRRLQDQSQNNSWVLELRSFYNEDKSPIDHYLFLPTFHLYKNYEYTFKINYRIYSTIYPGNLKLYLCSSKDINNKTLIKDFGNELNKTNWSEISTTFTIYNDDVYYLALCTYSEGNYMIVYLRDIWLGGVVGIEDDNNENNIIVFPNPADNTIHIVNNSDEYIENIDFVDIDGKNVLKHIPSLRAVGVAINTSELTKGTYIITITTKNKIYKKKIVKG